MISQDKLKIFYLILHNIVSRYSKIFSSYSPNYSLVFFFSLFTEKFPWLQQFLIITFRRPGSLGQTRITIEWDFSSKKINLSLKVIRLALLIGNIQGILLNWAQCLARRGTKGTFIAFGRHFTLHYLITTWIPVARKNGVP